MLIYIALVLALMSTIIFGSSLFIALKISSLCTELRGQDWQALGSQLNVPGATLSRIHQEYLSDPRRCMAEMFDSWLKQGEDVSWNQVAVALRNLHQMDLATRLIRKYCTGTETDRGEGEKENNNCNNRKTISIKMKEDVGMSKTQNVYRKHVHGNIRYVTFHLIN